MIANKRRESVRAALCLAAFILAPMGSAQAELPAAPSQAPGASAYCPPLPPSAGSIHEFYPNQVSQLFTALTNAVAGDVFLLHDGTYTLNGTYLVMPAQNMTIRSYSGNRDAVILDGGYSTTEIITMGRSNTVVADVTIKRAYTHAIHVTPYWTNPAPVTNTLIYNVRIIDPGEQAIKINSSGNYHSDGGVVACSTIELTDAGRPNIRNNCYTGGLDGHKAMGWAVRDNRIEGFWCNTGLSEHAVHFWDGSRDTLVERNVMVNNARGVGFGLNSSGSTRTYADNPCPGVSGYVDHYRGVVRNNFVYAHRAELFASSSGFDTGIGMWQTCNAQVLHNTIGSTQAPWSSIEWRFANTSAEIKNNLVSHNMMQRDSATATLATNLSNTLGIAASLFANWAAGDLHLASTATSAVNKGVNAGVTTDMDGQARDSQPDIGADEYVVLTPRAFIPVLIRTP